MCRACFANKVRHTPSSVFEPTARNLAHLAMRGWDGPDGWFQWDDFALLDGIILFSAVFMYPCAGGQRMKKVGLFLFYDNRLVYMSWLGDGYISSVIFRSDQRFNFFPLQGNNLHSINQHSCAHAGRHLLFGCSPAPTTLLYAFL